MSDDGSLDWENVTVTPAASLDDNWWDVSVTPAQTLPSDYNSSTGSWSDILKAIPVIGQTFASTYNAVNNPSAPTAYQQPQGQNPQQYGPAGSSNAEPSQQQSLMSMLTDFHSPYPYVAFGAVVLLVYAMKRR